MCREVNGQPQLLKDVFDEMSINAYDLSVDLLDCHADSNVYHRFLSDIKKTNFFVKKKYVTLYVLKYVDKV